MQLSAACRPPYGRDAQRQRPIKTPDSADVTKYRRARAVNSVMYQCLSGDGANKTLASIDTKNEFFWSTVTSCQKSVQERSPPYANRRPKTPFQCHRRMPALAMRQHYGLQERSPTRRNLADRLQSTLSQPFYSVHTRQISV